MLKKFNPLYRTQVTLPEQAHFHLLLHCCCMDGECHGKELRQACSTISTLYGADAEWLATEISIYQRYAPSITDDCMYLRFLIHVIKPTKPLLLLWQCAEIAVSDEMISYSEELLFDKLSATLTISTEVGRAFLYLAMQLHRKKELVITEPEVLQHFSYNFR